MTQHQYRGWIPTITGNLSFSIIATGKSPKKEFKSYFNKGQSKFTVVVQKRMTSDALFLYDFFKRNERVFYFLFLGISSEDDQFKSTSGKVYIVNKSDYWKLQYLLQNIRLSEDANRYKSEFSRLVCILNDKCEKHEILSAGFKIQRDGQIDIGTTENCSERSSVISSQIFYFIRDISHTHQHHQKSSDTILKLYEYTETPAPKKLKWKRETLYALYRWVIQQKRSQNEEAVQQCLGVLAYASSFEKLHIQTLSKKNRAALPSYNRKATIDSLNAQLDKVKDKKEGFLSAIFTKTLPILAIVLAVLTYSQTERMCDEICQASWQVQQLHFALGLVSKNPLIAIAFSLILPSIIFLQNFSKKYIFPKRPLRSAMRLIFAFRFKTAVLVLTILLCVFSTVLITSLLLLIGH